MCFKNKISGPETYIYTSNPYTYAQSAVDMTNKDGFAGTTGLAEFNERKCPIWTTTFVE